MKPRIVSNWFAGSAAKTSSVFFGYKEQSEETMSQYNTVLFRLLHLVQEQEVQLLLVDNTIQERKVVVFRFTSTSAYDTYRDELVQLAGNLERGIWEPWRDAEQEREWRGDLVHATPTIAF